MEGPEPSPDAVIRVLIADDHPLLLGALVERIGREADIDVVGTATDGEALIRIHGTTRPDVIVTDDDMPVLNGIEAIRLLRRTEPDLRALVLSGHADAQRVRDAVAAGAIGYLLKTHGGEDIVRAVRAAARGAVVFDDFAAGILVADVREGSSPAPRSPSLSERQIQVLELLAQGKSRDDIARDLFIGRATVSTHLKQVYQRLGTNDRLRAVRRATELGLLDADGHRVRSGPT
jgi:DNA-binding NarL/FixJ family response regulator